MTPPTPRGRRPGSPDTRQSILDAARTVFARDGLERASMREIARQAGVDPALLRHYFGDRSGLFLAAARIALDPRPILRRVLLGPRDGMGERILTTALTIWESPLGRSVLELLRARPELLPQFGTVMGAELRAAVDELLPHLPAAERRERVAVLEAVMIGLLTGRHLVRAEPLASMPRAVLVRRFAPVVQRLLT